MRMDRKLKKLRNILRRSGKVVIAYSGGVDSTFLLKSAIDALGRENVLAVTARSETYPNRECKQAMAVLESMKARHKVINTSEIGIRGFKSNPVNRCYYCKKELFSKIKKIAGRAGFDSVLDGTNYDDRKDIRYGRKAALELGVSSPLFEARITKPDIRRYSRSLGLPTHDKPAFACLASRVPFYSEITRKRLSRIDRAEDCIRDAGFQQVRVRDYGDLARIELEKKDIRRFFRTDRADIVTRLKKLGYRYITLDLEGYRTGSMNLMTNVKAQMTKELQIQNDKSQSTNDKGIPNTK